MRWEDERLNNLPPPPPFPASPCLAPDPCSPYQLAIDHSIIARSLESLTLNLFLESSKAYKLSMIPSLQETHQERCENGLLSVYGVRRFDKITRGNIVRGEGFTRHLADGPLSAKDVVYRSSSPRPSVRPHLMSTERSQTLPPTDPSVAAFRHSSTLCWEYGMTISAGRKIERVSFIGGYIFLEVLLAFFQIMCFHGIIVILF